MLRARLSATGNGLKYAKLAFAVLVAMTFCLAHPASTAYASKKDKKENKKAYGTIKIRTNPDGLPLSIDGKSVGTTTSSYQEYTYDPGLHTIVIGLPNGESWSREINVTNHRRKCVDLNYKPPVVVPTSPCPYPVNISVTPIVTEGDVITFTASASYSGKASLNYSWSVSPSDANVVGDANGAVFRVDSTNLGGKRVTATLTVDDGSGEAACRQTAQASTNVPKTVRHREETSTEFDVCCSCTYDDQKARLDPLGVKLHDDPSVTTFIIAYAGRNSRPGQAARLAKRANDYLVTNRGVDQSRVATMDGGYREEDCVELWIVPQGAQPPQPTPTLQPGEAPVKKKSKQ
jgi:hypothetical protein